MSDKERRRAQILDRAKDVFSRKGYHQAKIDDIVAAAKVARGTFYLYFQDKRSIFEELVNRFFQRIAMAVQRIDVRQPIEPQVKTNITNVLGAFLEDPAMAKILLADVTGLDIEFDRRLLAFYSDIVAMLERSLGEGQELGIVQSGERRVVAHFLLGGVKEVILQLVRAPVPVDRDAVVRDLYAVLSHGVLIEEPLARRGRKK
jgi:AcrR family transcriptional regulator